MEDQKHTGSNSQSQSVNIKYIKKLENKLNGEIGFQWWKRYIAAAIWDNLATPINLMITLLTAVSTAQANTNNFISESANSAITLITLLISTLNTFFRPHAKVNTNIEIMNRYNDFGNRFEEIYYSRDDVNLKIEKYKILMIDINKYEISQSSESINFCSDCVHILARYLCLKKREKWLDLDREFDEV